MDKKEYQLIEKCKQGDVNAKEWIYNKYAPLMLGVCLRYINNKAEAEDVLHESFIVLFNKIEQLKDNKSFGGWAKKIVINNSLQFLKKQNYDYNIDDVENIIIEQDSENESNSIKDRILSTDIYQEDMLSVINSLPIGFRTVFNLYVFENYKHSDIAKELSISEGTSKSQLLRARKLIQKRLYDLVLKKEKEKKKKVLLSSFIVSMDNDYDYIDKLAHDKLHNYVSNPSFTPESVINSGATATKSSLAGAKSKLMSIIAKKAMWISTAVIGTTASVVYVTNNNNNHDIENSVQTEIPMIIDADSILNSEDFDLQNENKNKIDNEENTNTNLIVKKSNKELNNKNSSNTTKTVHIKKTVRIVKKKYIVDTLRVVDTLR